MSVNLSTFRVTASIEGNISVANPLGPPVQAVNAKAVLDLVSGTGAGQADTVFAAQRTLASNANESLDLIGTLTDAFGGTVNAVKVVALYIKAAAANVNQVIVGGAASNGFYPMFGAATDTIKLPGGAALLLMNDAGYAATASTADLLKIANSSTGSTVTYDIVIVARSA